MIKTPPCANKSAIQGFEAYVLFGSSVFDTSRGANNAIIRNLTVDGNRANVTTSATVSRSGDMAPQLKAFASRTSVPVA